MTGPRRHPREIAHNLDEAMRLLDPAHMLDTVDVLQCAATARDIIRAAIIDLDPPSAMDIEHATAAARIPCSTPSASRGAGGQRDAVARARDAEDLAHRELQDLRHGVNCAMSGEPWDSDLVLGADREVVDRVRALADWARRRSQP